MACTTHRVGPTMRQNDSNEERFNPNEEFMSQMEKDYEAAYKELSDIPKYWIPVVEVEVIDEPK